MVARILISKKFVDPVHEVPLDAPVVLCEQEDECSQLL